MSFRSDIYGAVPGLGAAGYNYETSFRWGPSGLGAIQGMQISGAARDAGASPTSSLRPGLLLGQITASGLLKEYNPTGTDGSQNVYGILMEGLKVVDNDGTNTNRIYGVLVWGLVKAAGLLLLDENARAQMAGRFWFDDDLSGSTTGGYSAPVAKTADYTVVNSTDNGKTFTNQGASTAV